ncbi:MAG: twin-arginine translocation signal domain-containing protein [Gammaproteobacteria bacterium]
MGKKPEKSRREFLKGAAVAGGAVIVAATGKSVMAAEAEDGLNQDQAEKGYRETRHVRDYYDSTRH